MSRRESRMAPSAFSDHPGVRHAESEAWRVTVEANN